MDTPIQLNCALKYNADNILVGKDVLLNIRSRDIPECAALFSQFRQQFNITVGVMPIAVEETGQTPAVTTRELSRTNTRTGRAAPAPAPAMTTLTRTQTRTCPQCASPLVRGTCQKPGRFFGKDFVRCSDRYRCSYFQGI
jgi:hypothetical protein